ncbi:hypothetical protein N3P15_01540, partial [Treponema pallidum]
QIWRRGQDVYLQHVRAVHEGLCGQCDEYYTYNF